MNKNTIVTIMVVALALLAFVFFINSNSSNVPDTEAPQGNDDNTQSEQQFLNTIINPSLNYSFSYPDDFIELAIEKRENLPALGYIPPCTENYDSCIYYTGNRFQNTNFDSAGLSVHRLDGDVESCTNFTEANTLPNSEITTEQVGDNTFHVALSGDAGAGHIAEEVLYRTYHDNTCFEVIARTGYTQFGNYPEGSIGEFTDTDKNDLMDTMRSVVYTFSFEE